jgi:hypothetical protein
LEEIMSQLAANDRAFVWSLVEDFGDELAAVVRYNVASIGRREVLREEGRIEALFLDVAVLIFSVAPSWKADGGALPWVWARRPIQQLVSAELGHRVDELDEATQLLAEALTQSEGMAEGQAVAVQTLAGTHSVVASLVDALRTAGSERQVAIHIEYGTQRALGDPSPAKTVGAMFDMKPDNVRQIDSRLRKRVRELVANDPSYADLAGLRWLA